MLVPEFPTGAVGRLTGESGESVADSPMIHSLGTIALGGGWNPGYRERDSGRASG